MFVSTAASTAVTRFAGDRSRPSERAVVVGGALLSALAMSIVLLSVRAGLAIVGFAVVGLGLATIEPILYNDSTRVRSISRAGAIASVCSIGGFARRSRRPSPWPCRSSPRCYCSSARSACRWPRAWSE